MKRVLHLFTLMLVALWSAGVSPAVAADKITSPDNIVSGKTYYIRATVSSTDYYLKVASTTSTSVKGAKTQTESEAAQFVFTKAADSWTIQFADNSNYLGNGSSNAVLTSGTTAQTWSITSTSKSLLQLKNANRCLQANSGTSAKFGSYASGQIDVWLEEVPIELTASDFEITSSTTVSLTITAETSNPTSTVTYSTSSNGTITWTTSNSSVATVSNGVITAKGAGTATIKVSQAADDTYAASDEKSITVNVTDNSRVASDLALTGAPVALTFDLYNNKDAQEINYTTNGTGTVTVSASDYVTTEVGSGTITVTPVKVTAETQTITVSQAADATHAAGSVTFTVTVSDSKPISDETIDFTEQGWDNAADISSASGKAVSITFDKNTGTNAPKYYTGGARLYANNLLKIEATKTIESIVFTFADNNTKLALSTGQAGTLGSVSTSSPYVATWTGSATSLEFYANGGQARIKSIKIVYADDTKAKKPTLTDEAEFFGTMTVEMSSTEEGAVIYYTTDGSTPTAESTKYTEAITISETTTVKAIAVAGGKTSDVVSVTYTLITPLTVAEALATADNTEVYVSGIISRVDSYLSSYKSITYFISDDGSTESELEIYSGKGVDGANFSAVTDLEFGDKVVVKGTLTTYNSVKETKASSTIVSYTAKPASDLSKTSDIVLDYKGDDTMADVTKFFTTSSEGAITYTVGADGVVTNVDEIIEAVKVGTTTITVNQEADLNYKAGSVIINVTVQDTRVDATTIPGINISSLTENATGTIAVEGAEKADAGVTFAFVSDNEEVLYISGTEYLAGEAGTAKVTVTATASESKLYKNVTAEFTVTVNAAVKSDNTLAVTLGASTEYGTALAGTVTATTGFDGTINVKSSNEKVATVAITDGAVTVTTVAVGTATITFSAAETGKFNAASDVVKTVEVTAPAGKTEAPASSAATPIFTETFNQCDGTGGNDDKWSGSIATGNPTYDNEGWTLGGGKASKCVKLNKGAALVSPEIGTEGATSLTLTFKVAGWGTEAGDLAISVDDEDATLSSSAEAFTGSTWSDHEVTIDGITASSLQITFTAPSSKRCFIDEVVLTKLASAPSESVTLNASGYATYCSVNPIDFSVETEDYSAWKVTSIKSDGTINLDRISEAIKGGQGVLLYGAANSEINLTLADGTTDLSTTNKLHGTTAPQYFEANAIYGLSGNQFKHNNAGTIKANRAYLLDEDVDLDTNVKSFRLVFNDSTTGIIETREATAEEVRAIFDLSGRRLTKMQKGINIVGGKKVLVK